VRDQVTEEELARIKNWEGDWKALLSFMAAIWINTYGTVRFPVPNSPRQLWHFVTGGWSGNEEIMAAFFENRVAYSLLWASSHRGGLHILEECTGGGSKR
jgi:hypothetical protein